jgi:hypothetical protein
MIRAPPVCALTAQIASICISNVELQQFFAREPRRGVNLFNPTIFP